MSFFTPIGFEDYVKSHLKVNPLVDPADLRRRLRRALGDFRNGVTCKCGQPIWVVGSAEVGNSCFACITGETYSSADYELEEACNGAGKAAPKGRVRRHRRSR